MRGKIYKNPDSSLILVHFSLFSCSFVFPYKKSHQQPMSHSSNQQSKMLSRLSIQVSLVAKPTTRRLFPSHPMTIRTLTTNSLPHTVYVSAAERRSGSLTDQNLEVHSKSLKPIVHLLTPLISDSQSCFAQRWACRPRRRNPAFQARLPE